MEELASDLAVSHPEEHPNVLGFKTLLTQKYLRSLTNIVMFLQEMR